MPITTSDNANLTPRMQMIRRKWPGNEACSSPPEIACVNYWTTNSPTVQVVVAPQTTANTCVHMTVFSALPQGGVTLAYTLDHTSLKESRLDEPLS